MIQPDITHPGGILETKKLAAQADSYYVMLAPHHVGGQISTAAALHLAACTTNFRIQEYFNDFADPWPKEVVTGLPEVVDGYFSLPERPGLGLKLNLDMARAHPKQEVHFNLYAGGWQKRGKVGAWQASREPPGTLKAPNPSIRDPLPERYRVSGRADVIAALEAGYEAAQAVRERSLGRPWSVKDVRRLHRQQWLRPPLVGFP